MAEVIPQMGMPTSIHKETVSKEGYISLSTKPEHKMGLLKI